MIHRLTAFTEDETETLETLDAAEATVWLWAMLLRGRAVRVTVQRDTLDSARAAFCAACGQVELNCLVKRECPSCGTVLGRYEA